MAQKVVINQRPATKQARKSAGASGPNQLPKVIAMLVAAVAALAFSLTQVARISPKRGDVSGIVQEMRKDHPAAGLSLPSRSDATRGAKLWMKKGEKG
jgi:hypothetical protein